MDRAEGNPFYAEELLAAGETTSLPGELRGLLLARVERLTEFLLTAVQHHVLVADADGVSYSFRHALVREAVYDDMLPGERHRMHARLAITLAAGAQAGPAAPSAAELGQLAYH